MKDEQDSVPENLDYFSQQIESSKNAIEVHQKNIKAFEIKVYELLLQKKEEIKKKQLELIKELEKVENQLLVWDYVREFNM